MTRTRPAILTLLALFASLALPFQARADDRGQLAALARTRTEVYVTYPDGLERKGRVLSVRDDGLRLTFAGRETLVPWADIVCVERRGDPIWDGAAKGMAISALFYAAVALAAAEDFDGEILRFVAGASLAWGGVGATIDAFNVGRSTVYVGTPELSRAIGPVRQGPPRDRGLVVGGRIGF
jgi:hypothetical protein